MDRFALLSDSVAELPWNISTREETIDIHKAEAQLEADHFGLEVACSNCLESQAADPGTHCPSEILSQRPRCHYLPRGATWSRQNLLGEEHCGCFGPVA